MLNYYNAVKSRIVLTYLSSVVKHAAFEPVPACLTTIELAPLTCFSAER